MQVGAREVGATKVSSAEVGTGEVDAAQHRICQTALAEVDVGEPSAVSTTLKPSEPLEGEAAWRDPAGDHSADALQCARRWAQRLPSNSTDYAPLPVDPEPVLATKVYHRAVVLGPLDGGRAWPSCVATVELNGESVHRRAPPQIAEALKR